jgi:KDO2-lipid IV(A) lauroyltransferase
VFRKLRHLAEYAALRAALLPLDALPLPRAARAAAALADAAFALGRSRRALATGNVLASGICADPAGAAAVARESFRHLAVVIVESLKAHRFLGETTWRDHVRLDAHPDALRLLQDPSAGLILATGHIGCWEVGAQALSYIKPVVAIARPMNNPYADRLMNRRRAAQRFRTTPKRGPGGSRLLSVIRRGEALAVMIDQHARDGGVILDFLGRPAATYTSPARLHLATAAPLCFASCVRTAPLAYRLRVSAPIVHPAGPDRARDVRAILEILTRHLEAAVRENPGQYLWAHRRWRAADITR